MKNEEKEKAFNEKVANRLKCLRIGFGFTQKEIEEKLGVRDRTLFDFETNRVRIRVDVLVKLCRIYKITPNELLDFK